MGRDLRHYNIEDMNTHAEVVVLDLEDVTSIPNIFYYYAKIIKLFNQ